jgi:hypothetical protein
LQPLKNFEACSSVQRFMFLWIIITWHSMLSNAMCAMLVYKNWNVFTNVTPHWGRPQYSSQQPFKVSLPGPSGSDHGGGETCIAHIAFEQGRRWSVFLGSRILWSLQWWCLGMYWVLSQLTWNPTCGWKSIELCPHSWIAVAGQTTACSTSKISRQLWQLTTWWQCWWHHLL